MADDDATARRTTGTTKGGPAKKAAAARAAVVKKAPAKKATKKVAAPPARATAAKKKAPAARRTADEDRGAVLAPRKKAPPPLRLAAERTFDDDWDQPVPEPAPVREDPAARVRSLLRAAALSLQAKEEAPRRAVPVATPTPPIVSPPDVPPAVPSADREPVTRVLVAPVPPDPELDVPEDEDDVDDPDDEADDATVVGGNWRADDTDEQEEWSPPEVLDDQRPGPAAAAPPPPPTSPPPPPTSPPPAPTPAPAPSGPVTDFSSIDIVGPPQADRPARSGPLLPIFAIVLAIFGPILGAVVALFLAGRARRRGAALAGLARVVAVLALIGWVAVIGVVFLALRDGGIDYSKLKVGDCFGSSQSNEIRGVKVQDCAKPHNSEIFFLVTHPAGPKDAYPGKDALVQFAADACLGQPFTDYLGVTLEASKLKDFEIVPQESAWKDGRRLLVCGIDAAGQGDITGSVKGTRR